MTFTVSELKSTAKHRWAGQCRRDNGSVGRGRMTPLGGADVDVSMATRRRAGPASLTRSFSLRELGASLPVAASDVEVVVHGDRAAFEIEVTRTHTWIVEGQGAAGALTAVFDAERTRVELPQSVPDWLAAVLAELAIDEVSMDET